MGIVSRVGHIEKGAVTTIVSDNSTMTAQLAATGKVVLFEGLKERLLPFLDITPLMPPERLRMSRLLKRPLMEGTTPNEESISQVFIEEVLPYPECDVEVQYNDDGDIYVATGPLDELLLDFPEQSSFFWVLLRSDLDREFGAVWRAMHGADWPFVADRTAHPALINLHRRYVDFWRRWCDHGAAIMEAFDGRLAAECRSVPTITCVMRADAVGEVAEEQATEDEASSP